MHTDWCILMLSSALASGCAAALFTEGHRSLLGPIQVWAVAADMNGQVIPRAQALANGSIFIILDWAHMQPSPGVLTCKSSWVYFLSVSARKESGYLHILVWITSLPLNFGAHHNSCDVGVQEAIWSFTLSASARYDSPQDPGQCLPQTSFFSENLLSSCLFICFPKPHKG